MTSINGNSTWTKADSIPSDGMDPMINEAMNSPASEETFNHGVAGIDTLTDTPPSLTLHMSGYSTGLAEGDSLIDIEQGLSMLTAPPSNPPDFSLTLADTVSMASAALASQEELIIGGESLSGEGNEAAPLPNYTLNQIGDFLKEDYWDWSWGGYYHSFNMGSSGTGANSGIIYYDYDGFSGSIGGVSDSNGLTTARRALVDDALDYIGELLGISFIHDSTPPSGGVDLYFMDSASGAYANSSLYGSGNGSANHYYIDYSWVNINDGWWGGNDDINGYTYQTFIHEIGHALGLGHAGEYNGSANYVTDTTDPDYGNNSNNYLNDCWQQTIMSYFDQTENTTINADYNYVITYMAGDFEALRDYYGATSAFNGNTVYGFNTNITTAVSEVMANLATYADEAAFAIIDSDGNDTVDFSGYSANQTINIYVAAGTSTTGTLSDIGGQIGNMALGVGTVIENAKGGSGNDTLYGNIYDNDLYGNAGNDYIYAYDGNDYVYGGSGTDTLYGSGGTDYLYGADGVDGDGETGNNYLSAGDDNDYLRGGDLADTLYGGNGDDELRGNAGNDYLDGDAGTDEADYSYASAAVSANLTTGTATGGDGTDTLVDIENLSGSAYNDTLTGNTAGNVINGAGGADSIDADDGADTTYGSSGNDRIVDGDFVNFDVHDGGADTDWIDYSGVSFSSGVVTINLTAGLTSVSGGNTETITNFENADGSQGGETLYGTTGSNILNGNGGNDTLRGSEWADQAIDGNDSLYGGAGDDFMGGHAGNDSMSGDSGNDSVIGDAGNDTLYGGTGDDWVVGDYTDSTGNGNDQLHGEDGADTLEGGTGNDYLYGNSGSDDLYGGAGIDYLYGADGVDGSGETGTNYLSGGDDNDYLRGGDLADTLYGGNGDDELRGNAGNDYLDGDAGTDEANYLYATAAVTVNLATGTATGGDGSDTLVEIENIYASNYNDTLTGTSGSNVISGNSGNDSINAGAGQDTVYAGSGDDIIVDTEVMLASEDDVYDGGSGTDTLVHDLFWISTVTFDLTAGYASFSGNRDQLISIENLTVGGAATVIGDANNNILTVNGIGANNIEGRDGNDTINAGGGNDTVDGGNGNDSLEGGDGNDSLTGGGGVDTVNGGNGDDSITDANSLSGDVFDGGAGTDTLIADFTWVDNVAYDLTAGWMRWPGTAGSTYDTILNIENLIIGGGADVTGSSVANIITVLDTGSFHDNTISTGGGNDTVSAGIGNDVIDGGTGADSMAGGQGNDTYTVDDAGDVTTENAGEGTDTVNSGISWTLGAELENLTLTGAANINGTGNGLNNVILGNSGNNSLDGQAGNDSIDGGAGDDTLTGGDGTDTLLGGEGNDVLSQSYGGPNEIMNGGNGSDTGDWSYSMFDIWNIDLAAGTAKIGATVYAQLTSIENVVGGQLGDVISGDAGDNRLDGQGGNDDLLGGGGLDTLLGGLGNDTLDGGTGADNLDGGDGNDLYVVDDLGDVAAETGTGTDTVQSSVTWTLSANLEHLTLTGAAAINGTGNGLDNALTGNGAANTLTGLAGNDTLDGGAGDDSLVGGLGNDLYQVDSSLDVVKELTGQGQDTVYSTALSFTLNNQYVEDLILVGAGDQAGKGNSAANILVGQGGNNLLQGQSGDDTLLGGGGNDTLNGGYGQDSMVGGVGDDTYWVNSSSDLVVEIAGEGNDRVYSQAGTYTLSDNVETLVNELTSGTQTGRGNAGANTLVGGLANDNLQGLDGNDSLQGGEGNDTLSGGNNEDTLKGGNGSDILNGGDGDDSLQGNDGADTLNGGAGTDTQLGGGGDDVYLSVTSVDVLTEYAGGGYDKVYASGSFTLSNHLEYLELTHPTANHNGTGNNQDNVLVGNGGANILSGLGGADQLHGMAGNDSLYAGADAVEDQFFFETALNAGTNVDTLYEADFAEDQIMLDNDIFTALLSGTSTDEGILGAGFYFEGSGLNGNGAADAVGIWYDLVMGGLYYNPTSGTAGDSVLFALLDGASALLDYTDFTLVA